MELFAIHCTTCKARLKVTDPSVIGQILSCPKCESMVMIEPPAGWSSAGIAGVATIPVSKQPTVSTRSAAKVSSSTAPPPLPQPVVASPKLVPPAVSVATAPQLTLPNSDSQVAGAKAVGISRDWLVFGGGIAAGVIVGAAVWLLIAMRGSDASAVATAEANAAVVEPASTTVKPAAEAAVVSEPASADANAKSTSVKTMKPVIDEPDSPEPRLEDPATEIASPTGVEPEVEAEVSPIEPTATPAEAPQPTEDPVPAEAPSAADAIPVAEAAVEPETTGPASDPLVDRLNVKLPKVAFDKVPLRQFVAFAAEASGTRIVIDYASLKKAGFKVPLITARASDRPLRQVLDESLDKAGLKYESRDGAIVIFVP